jgi:polar amino acid transport system substrate-binding protein
MRTFRTLLGHGLVKEPLKPRRLLVLALAVIAVMALMTVTAACGKKTATKTTTVAGVKIKSDPALHDMLPQAILDAGKVRVACDIPYPPWEMYTEAGGSQITGIDYDIAQAIAAKLDIPFVFQRTIFDSIIPSLKAGKADVGFSCVYDNLDRQKVFDFVDYAKDGTALLVKKGNPDNITGIQSLAGKTVAVESGTTQLLLLQAAQKQFKANGLKEMKILQLPKDSDAQLAVKAGRAVCDATDGPGSVYVAQTAGNGKLFEVVVDPAYPNGYDPQTIGAEILKSNTKLRDAIKKALQALFDDGTYAKILDKYGQASAAVTSITVNLK